MTEQPNPMACICGKCDGVMIRSKAIAQTYTAGAKDFASDKHSVTFSAGGPGKLVDCVKCQSCGWSYTI